MDNTEPIVDTIDTEPIVVDTIDTEPIIDTIDNITYDNDVCIDEQKETMSIESIIITNTNDNSNSNSISAPNSSNNSYVISSSVSSGNKSNEDILSYINDTIYLWNKDIEPNTGSNEDSNIFLPISSRLNIFDNKDIIQEIIPVIPEIIPVIPEIIQDIKEIIPVIPEIIPVIPEIIPVIPEIIPVIPEIIQDIKEIIPVIPEIIPAIPEIIPVIQEIIPAIPEIVPVIPEIIPVIPEIIQNKDNISHIVSFNSDNIKDIISYSNNNNNINNINNIENIISNGNSNGNSIGRIIGHSIGNSNSIENSIENDSVFNSESEFSYTKNLSICNTPNILRGSKNKNNNNNNNNNTIKLKNKKKNKDKNCENELDDIDYLYNKLQDYIRYMDINRSNYILIIVKAMEIIENHNSLIENNKKHTVTKAINRLLTIDLDLSEFDKNLFLLSLNNIIEIIINCSKTQDNTKSEKPNKNHINNINNNNNINIVNSGQIIHSLIDKITTIIIKKQYNVEKLFVNIVTITSILIILVNKYSYINNIEKKYIVIQAFNKFVNERLEFIINISKDNKKKILISLESVQITIDIILGLQNGEYKINSSETTFEKQKKSLFNCFKKRKDYDI